MSSNRQIGRELDAVSAAAGIYAQIDAMAKGADIDAGREAMYQITADLAKRIPASDVIGLQLGIITTLAEAFAKALNNEKGHRS